MNAKHVLFAIVAGILVATMAAAQSILLLQSPDYESYGISDAEYGRSLAENFVLSSDSLIQEVVVWGIGSDPNIDDAFTVLFHENDGGIPGVVVSSASGLVPRFRATTGQYVHGRPEYVYFLRLPVAVSLGGGTWWVEVFSSIPGEAWWGWEGGIDDPIHGVPGCVSADEAPGAFWTSRSYGFSILVVGSTNPLLSDGFESGDTRAWSWTEPPDGGPNADFTFVATGLSVDFNNQSTGEQPLSYLWDFGDGTIPPNRTETNPIHTYTNPVAYNVTLTVTNATGSDSVVKQVVVDLQIPVRPFLLSWSRRSFP